MKNKILLIGGAGFIGSRFSHMTDYDCNVVDKTLGSDIINRNVLPKGWYDTVIFLAAEPNLASVQRNPMFAYSTMTHGLHMCLEQYHTSHFVYISSSMVYGNWTHDSMQETDFASPVNVYGQLKLLGEGIVKQFHNNWTIVRPSAVYGPGDKPNRVVNLFIDKIKNNKPIELQGAYNLFDFTYVDDVVHGLQRIVDLVPQSETYNITRGEAHTLQSMTDMLYAKLGKEKNYTLTPRPSNYPMRGSLNILKAQEELEYNPQYDLGTGLDDTLNKLG